MNKQLTVLVSPPNSGWTMPPVGTYSIIEGTMVRLDALANPGFFFSYWEDEVGNRIYGPAVLLPMDIDHTVTAYFSETVIPPGYQALRMEVSPADSGYTEPSVGVNVYAKDTPVLLTAYPNSGYAFVKWIDSAGKVGVTNPILVMMDKDYTVTAYFKVVETLKYDLTVVVDPADSGWTEPPIGTYSYDAGAVVAVTTLSRAGYEFEYWEDETGNRVYDLAIQVTMGSDHTVTAYFKIAEVTQYDLTIAVAPLDSGRTEPPVGTYPYDEGTVVILSALAYTNYEFDYWEDETGNKIYDRTIQVTMGSDHAVTAHFKPTTATQYTLSVEIRGSGSMIPGGGIFNEGDVVQLTAYPNSGWEFSEWYGTDNDTMNPTAVTMTQDKPIVITFVETGEEPGEPGEPGGIDLSEMMSMMMVVMMMSVMMESGGG